MIATARMPMFAAVFMCLCVLSARGAEYQLVPISATGAHTIVGNEIRVEPGARVILEHRGSGWDPEHDGTPKLGVYQAEIIPASLSNGTSTLQFPFVACVGAPDCAAVLGAGSPCEPAFPGCVPYFINTAHAEFALAGFPVIAASSVSDIAWGAISLGAGAPDVGNSRYFATFIVDVPLGAEGTFVLEFNPDPARTFMAGENGTPILEMDSLQPARIVVAQGSCCHQIGVGTTQCADDVTLSECNALPGPRVFRSMITCAEAPCPLCASDAQCADNSFCNGPERCDPQTGCQPSAGFRDCSDNDACTIDSCDENNSVCDHIPDQECLEDTGACCDASPGAGGMCTDGVRPDQCLGAHHAWTRDALCAQVICQEVTGACCATNTGVCTSAVPLSACQGANSAWTEGVTCSQVTCDAPPRPYCLPSGACHLLPESIGVAVGGVPVVACLGDGDGDGLDDACASDCDFDGIINIDEPDPRERDCDGDGICNGAELNGCQGNPACSDCDTNGVPDGCQPDCDGDGVPDACEIAACSGNPACVDCDDDDVPDGCQPDCDSDGVADACEILSCTIGDSSCEDLDGNGVPDSCEPTGGACCYHPFGGLTCFMSDQWTCEAWFNGSWHPNGNCETLLDAVEVVENGTVFYHRIDQPDGCPTGDHQPRSRQGCGSGPYFDGWVSQQGGGALCEQFGSGPEAPPIPAGFFGLNSDPFSSLVCFKGVSLAHPNFGDADTLIQRGEDPFDRCGLPSGTPVAVSVDILELNLASVAPIVVTHNGGQSPELWDVAVDTSTVSPPSGTLTATKTHCNGGTYTNALNVSARFTFTKVGEPTTTRVLDTGVEGAPPVTLSVQWPAPWVHDVSPELGLVGDACSDFHPAVVDLAPQSSCDCNGNGVRDKCDIEQATSTDCNANQIPDDCDIDSSASVDCNANDVPDECEPDCNGNTVADACDLSSASSLDINGNAVPDECERAVQAPVADALVKNRYISFRPRGKTDGSLDPVQQALRVTSSAFPGLVKWVGAPDGLRISRLQCTPHYRDWGLGMLHVADLDIRPGTTYVVLGIGQGASIANVAAYSDPPTTILTAVYGNLVPPLAVNFLDVSAGVDAFKMAPNAPPRSVADVAPAVPDKTANFLDISYVVDAFRGRPFPYGAPASCP